MPLLDLRLTFLLQNEVLFEAQCSACKYFPFTMTEAATS